MTLPSPLAVPRSPSRKWPVNTPYFAVADIGRVGLPGRRDDDPARAGFQLVEIAVRKAGRDRSAGPGRAARRSPAWQQSSTTVGVWP